MLKVESVSLNYDRDILKDITLSVSEGEIIGIVGKVEREKLLC